MALIGIHAIIECSVRKWFLTFPFLIFPEEIKAERNCICSVPLTSQIHDSRMNRLWFIQGLKSSGCEHFTLSYVSNVSDLEINMI